MLLLPFALAAVYLYGFNMLREMIGLGGYRSYLEKEIRRRTGRPLLMWESEIVKPVIQNGRSVVIVFSFFAALYLVAVFGSAWTAFHFHHHFLHAAVKWGIPSGVGVLTALLAIVGLDSRWERDRVRRKIAEVLERDIADI